MKFATILMFVMTVATFFSCTKDIRKKGSGVILTVSRNLDPFNDVDVGGAFEIFAHISAEPHVVISTDDNLIEDVQTFVQDDKLVIEMDDDVWNYRPTKMEIHIYGPSYSRIDLDGAVEFEMQDTTQAGDVTLFHNGSGRAEILAHCNNLWMEVNGSADLMGAGTSTNASYIINGSGKVNTLEMTAYDADAIIHGSGNIYVNCSHHLNAEIDGSGDIRYLGSPTVHSEINGSGSVGPY